MVFYTPYPDQIYCTDTCQRREKARRRRDRRLEHKARTEQHFTDERFHATVANPTSQQMTEICVDVAEGKFKKPILVIGILPKDYLKPVNVDVTEQQTIEANATPRWVVVRKELGALDVFLSQGPK